MNLKWITAALLAASCVVAEANPQAILDRQLPLPRKPKNEIIPGYIKVRYRLPRAEQLAQSLGNEGQAVPLRVGNATLVDRIDGTGWTLWSYSPLLSYEAVKAQFKADPETSFIEPLNKVYPLLSIPNDLDWGVEERGEEYILNFGEDDIWFNRLWHLDDVSAFGGWSTWPNTWYTAATKPKTAPLIAIIDTGCDMNHPDFINEGGTGTDTSQGGQFMKKLSKYFKFGEPVKNGSPEDHQGHGTHVTGIALAAGNNGGFNGHGVIGTGYACRALICRVFDDTGNGSDWDSAGAIYYAATQKAVVMNLSLGTENYSQIFQDAVTSAFQQGSLVVAAGNESGSGGGDLGPIYPAACSGALCVTANGPNQLPATNTYTGYGYYVDLAAPGGDVAIGTDYIVLQYIWSTAMRGHSPLQDDPNMYPPYLNDYTYLIGTSMACPVVSGAAGNYYGMMKYTFGNWNNLAVYQALEKSADGGGAGGGWEPIQGYGNLNMDSLMNGIDTKGATAGGVEGICYIDGIPTQNVAVKAQRSGSSFVFTTTTFAGGAYRFDPMPPGTYTVTAGPAGRKKSKKVIITAGCDMTGVDFWVGPTDDTTPPVVPTLSVSGVATSKFKLSTFGYDPETGLDSITYQLGTTAGASNVLPMTEMVARTSATLIKKLTLTSGTTYYLTMKYTNGQGLVTTASTSFVAP